ncbi:nucleotidyltransferase domain-containing protein [archaeon]|nr:nucleotidyltransferase domain-containing protein [archaeon]
MLTQGEIDILVCFFPKLENMTSREIELKSGFSHETVFRLLKGIVKKRHLKMRKIGKTNVYEFVKDELTYQIYVSFITKKRLNFKEKHLLIYKRLYEFLNEIKLDGTAILFGSYSKGTQTKNSDVDLLCATNRKNVKNIIRTFRTKYNMNIHVVAVKLSDFKNIRKDNPAFWKDLIEYGIVLDGLDYFFKEVYAND